jgi:Tfp pilus assembly protein PilW
MKFGIIPGHNVVLDSKAPVVPAWAWDSEHTADADTLVLIHGEDNAANTTITDSSGNGYNFTASSNTSNIYTASGKFGGGFYLNDLYGGACTTAGLMTAMANASRDKFTLEFWFKADTTNWAAQGNQWFFRIDVVDTSSAVALVYAAGGAMYGNSSGGGSPGSSDTIDHVDWHHYAITCNGATDEMSFFIDGVSKQTAAYGNMVAGNCIYVKFCTDNGGNDKPDGIIDEWTISKKIRY